MHLQHAHLLLSAAACLPARGDDDGNRAKQQRRSNKININVSGGVKSSFFYMVCFFVVRFCFC